MKTIIKYLKYLVYPESSFYKEVAWIALPVALQGLINIGVNLTDTLMIGMLGERQLSASSLATQYVNMFHTFCMGLSMGASVLASRYWGMQEIKSLKKTIAIMMRLSIALAVFFALTTWAFPDWIMQMYTDEADIITFGKEYLRYCTAAYFFNGLSLTTTIILRSIRQVKIPLITSIITFFINIGANYVLMFGKLGFPQMGISGAALSTLIVRIIEFTVICGYLLAIEKKVKFRIGDLFMPCKDLVGEYFRIGLPVLISDGIMAFGNNFVMMIIGHLGAAFAAANAITAVVERLSGILIQGVSQGSAVVTGNTLGKGETEKVERQGWAFLGLGIVLGALSAMVITCISGAIISWYNLTEETAYVTRQLLYAVSVIVVFTAMNSILTKGTLRGGGDTKMLMVADNIFMWFASIPLGILAGMIFHFPAFWIYICLKSDNVFKAVWCIFRLKSKKWIKKINPIIETMEAEYGE